MINPKELRPGNLVKYTGEPYPFYPLVDGIFEVEEVLRDGANRSQGDSTLYEADRLEGISLTPEWLEKFGFTAVSNCRYNGPAGMVITRETQGDDSWKIFGINSVLINTVHHLQNIFHALSYEELTIKETK